MIPYLVSSYIKIAILWISIKVAIVSEAYPCIFPSIWSYIGFIIAIVKILLTISDGKTPFTNNCWQSLYHQVIFPLKSRIIIIQCIKCKEVFYVSISSLYKCACSGCSNHGECLVPDCSNKLQTLGNDVYRAWHFCNQACNQWNDHYFWMLNL